MIQDRGVLASIFDENLFLEPETMWGYAQHDNRIGMDIDRQHD